MNLATFPLCVAGYVCLSLPVIYTILSYNSDWLKSPLHIHRQSIPWANLLSFLSQEHLKNKR